MLQHKSGGLWEILVPVRSNEGKKFSVQKHREWDAKVRKLAGGLTIFRPAKGQWLSPNYSLFKEEMIPVRIQTTKLLIKEILDITAEHYGQQAVMAYLISEEVLLRWEDEA